MITRCYVLELRMSEHGPSNPAMQEVLRALAKLAVTAAIKEGPPNAPQPTVIVYSDDFFKGHEDIVT